MNAAASRQTIRYEVIVHELCFSGAPGAPCSWAMCEGPRAKQRALECAEREQGSRASITAVEVVQRGGAADGKVLVRYENPGAYMVAGNTYTAAIYVDRCGRIIALEGVSRDSRLRYSSPPTFVSRVLEAERAVA